MHLLFFSGIYLNYNLYFSWSFPFFFLLIRSRIAYLFIIRILMFDIPILIFEPYLCELVLCLALFIIVTLLL